MPVFKGSWYSIHDEDKLPCKAASTPARPLVSSHVLLQRMYVQLWGGVTAVTSHSYFSVIVLQCTRAPQWNFVFQTSANEGPLKRLCGALLEDAV